MTIYSGFSYKKWWCSIVMLVYQRVQSFSSCSICCTRFFFGSLLHNHSHILLEEHVSLGRSSLSSWPPPMILSSKFPWWVETLELGILIFRLKPLTLPFSYAKTAKKSCLPTHHHHPSPASQDQGVAFYVLKAIVTLAYPYPPPQMLTLCGSLLDIVIAIMKLFHSEARIQERMLFGARGGTDLKDMRFSDVEHLHFLKGFPFFLFFSLSLSFLMYIYHMSHRKNTFPNLWMSFPWT